MGVKVGGAVPDPLWDTVIRVFLRGSGDQAIDESGEGFGSGVRVIFRATLFCRHQRTYYICTLCQYLSPRETDCQSRATFTTHILQLGPLLGYL